MSAFRVRLALEELGQLCLPDATSTEPPLEGSEVQLRTNWSVDFSYLAAGGAIAGGTSYSLHFELDTGAAPTYTYTVNQASTAEEVAAQAVSDLRSRGYDAERSGSKVVIYSGPGGAQLESGYLMKNVVGNTDRKDFTYVRGTDR